MPPVQASPFLPPFLLLMSQGCLAAVLPSISSRAARRGVDGTSQPLWHHAHAGSVKPVSGARSGLLSGKVVDIQVSSDRPAFSGNCSLNHSGHMSSRFFSFPLESSIENNFGHETGLGSHFALYGDAIQNQTHYPTEF